MFSSLQLIYILLFLAFSFWGIERIVKFFKQFSNYHIDEKKHQIRIDKEVIEFRNIKNVTIEEISYDIDSIDQFLLKDTGRLSPNRIILLLNDETQRYINTRYKKEVYSICKTFMKYKKCDINLKSYKEPFLTFYEFVIAVICYFSFGKIFPIPLIIALFISIYLISNQKTSLGFILFLGVCFYAYNYIHG